MMYKLEETKKVELPEGYLFSTIDNEHIFQGNESFLAILESIGLEAMTYDEIISRAVSSLNELYIIHDESNLYNEVTLIVNELIDKKILYKVENNET